MPLVKKLYLFILNTFLPLFLMTFFISLFVLLMQFLWKYVDELVGKGIEVGVLGELFFYAALTIVPMALPLSMLLASLMTFETWRTSRITGHKSRGNFFAAKP